ncbi:MAG: superoxide dismutase [Phycisphaerales bacterium]|nr:MAG: superoxide dismutase [Phycisphaerales bacterium]
MLGTLGGLAVAGGWIGLDTSETVAAPPEDEEPGKPKEYILPALPYDYDALEPHIDAKTMMLHHDKHHAGYVKGLNETLAELAIVSKSGSADVGKVRSLTDELAFNGSGHVLHTVFWSNMAKNGGGAPSGTLARFIDRDFGDLMRMKAQLSAAAKKVQGSGWGVLAWEPLSGRMLVFGAEKHQNWTMWGSVPLLVLDVWEHAYYLKYQSDRGGYVNAFWNVVNWDNVAERLEAARKLTA